MKRIFIFLISLVLMLSLCACRWTENSNTTSSLTTTTATLEDSTANTTIGFVPSPETTIPEAPEAFPYEHLTEKTGIDAGYEYHTGSNIFTVCLTWTNKLDVAVPFGGTYLLDVFQGDTELGSNDMTAEEFATLTTPVEPGSTITITLRFVLIDNTTPIIVKFGDASTNTYFTEFPYDLTAVG